MYPSINKVYLEFHIHLKVNYNSELVWLSFCMKCYGIMWVNIYDQRLVRVAPPQNPFPQLLHPLLSRHRRSGYAVALIITILLVAKQARSKSDARFPSYRSSNRSKTKFAKYLSQSLQPYCLSIRSDGARTDGMRGGEQLSAPMSLCGRDRRLPWEESDQRARHLARRHHRAVSGASLNVNGGASLWLGITNTLIFFLQPPRAEFHYGTAAEIVLQLSTTATHRPVQQQHLPDCPRCTKRPKAVNHSVSR